MQYFTNFVIMVKFVSFQDLYRFRLVDEGFALEFHFVGVTILTALFWRIEILWR